MIAALTFLGCSDRSDPPEPTGATAAAPDLLRFEGTVHFEARIPTPQGLSADTQRLPARRLQLLVHDADKALVARGQTDDEGHFSLEAPGAGGALVLIAAVPELGLSVTLDSQGTEAHARVIPLPEAPTEPLAIEIRDADEDGFAGALHILDSLTRGALAVRAWTGRTLPPFFAYWVRGETTDWSFYHGERPEGSGRYALELMGGSSDDPATSDTDEHDSGIVLHEMGHFVMDVLTDDSSIGGLHPPGTLLDPGLAWEEARASWFATTVLGAPLYRDSIGFAPVGRLRLDHDLENGGDYPYGLGSEQGAAEILWDLSDGADGVPDVDDDGIAVGPARLLQAMIALSEEPGSYPSIATFLRFLVDHQHVQEGSVRTMLARGGHSTDLLPAAGERAWPVPLESSVRARGLIDSASDPAPSGGAARPHNGFDAVDAYLLEVVADGQLELKLSAMGRRSSAQSEPAVIVELRDAHAELLELTPVPGRGSRRTFRREVEAGYYVVYVRDGGTGVRTRYELTAEFPAETSDGADDEARAVE